MRYQPGMQRRYGGGATPEETDAEFVARVESVGPQPEFLNGRVLPFQRLDVTVTEVRRGDGVAAGDYLPLDVFIAAGEPHIGVGEFDMPALDSSMVQPGVLIVAWANRNEQNWEAVQISTDGPPRVGGNLYWGYRY